MSVGLWWSVFGAADEAVGVWGRYVVVEEEAWGGDGGPPFPRCWGGKVIFLERELERTLIVNGQGGKWPSAGAVLGDRAFVEGCGEQAVNCLRAGRFDHQ